PCKPLASPSEGSSCLPRHRVFHDTVSYYRHDAGIPYHHHSGGRVAASPVGRFVLVGCQRRESVSTLEFSCQMTLAPDVCLHAGIDYRPVAGTNWSRIGARPSVCALLFGRPLCGLPLDGEVLTSRHCREYRSRPLPFWFGITSTLLATRRPVVAGTDLL